MKLNGKHVAILATDLFEESELMGPKQALEAAGADVVIIAPHAGTIQGVRHTEPAAIVPVTETLADADPDDYDAVLLPGGALNADALRMEAKAQAFVQQIDNASKPLAVICHAPWLLISAGLVNGRRMTSYHTIADDLQNAGAIYQNQAVVTDHNWVSSRQPDDLSAFNKAFMALLAQQKSGQPV